MRVVKFKTTSRSGLKANHYCYIDKNKDYAYIRRTLYPLKDAEKYFPHLIIKRFKDVCIIQDIMGFKPDTFAFLVKVYFEILKDKE